MPHAACLHSAPLGAMSDNLSYVLQHLDHATGSLNALLDDGPKSALSSIYKQYWQIVNVWHPDGSEQSKAVFHFLEQSFDREAFQAELRALCVRLAAAVWCRLQLRFGTPE